MLFLLKAEAAPGQQLSPTLPALDQSTRDHKHSMWKRMGFSTQLFKIGLQGPEYVMSNVPFGLKDYFKLIILRNYRYKRRSEMEFCKTLYLQRNSIQQVCPLKGGLSKSLEIYQRRKHPLKSTFMLLCLEVGFELKLLQVFVQVYIACLAYSPALFCLSPSLRPPVVSRILPGMPSLWALYTSG